MPKQNKPKRNKTNRTERITLMISSGSRAYIEELAHEQDHSVSALMEQVIQFHKKFSPNVHFSGQNTEALPAAA